MVLWEELNSMIYDLKKLEIVADIEEFFFHDTTLGVRFNDNEHYKGMLCIFSSTTTQNQ